MTILHGVLIFMCVSIAFLFLTVIQLYRIISDKKNTPKKTAKFQTGELITFNAKKIANSYNKHLLKKFNKNQVFVFLCEIEQNPKCCIIMHYHTGEILTDISTEEFKRYEGVRELDNTTINS